LFRVTQQVWDRAVIRPLDFGIQPITVGSGHFSTPLGLAIMYFQGQLQASRQPSLGTEVRSLVPSDLFSLIWKAALTNCQNDSSTLQNTPTESFAIEIRNWLLGGEV
jgi:hypothetical protein